MSEPELPEPQAEHFGGATGWQVLAKSYTANQMLAYAAEAVAAERDCRLCASYSTASGGCVSVLRCVAGDRFKATAPRQYWEARPIEPAPF